MLQLEACLSVTVSSTALCLNGAAFVWLICQSYMAACTADQCVCCAPASAAESRTPGLLSVILPPAEVLVMPGDRPEWIEKEWKIGAGR